MLILGVCLGLIVTIIIFVIIILNKNNITYVDDPPKEIITDVDTPPERKGKYSTIIVTDNFYEGVSIKNKKDINKLIIEDSVKQKKYCPEEILEIENTIIKKFDITAVNLCELSTDFSKELVNVLQVIYDEYPEIRGNLTNLTLINTSINESYIAAFAMYYNFATADTTSTYPWGIKTQIFLNTKYFLNESYLDSSVEAGSASGHFTPNATKYSVVAHEFGHYLSYMALLKSKNIESTLLVNEKNLDLVYEIMANYSQGKYSLDMIEEAYRRYVRDTGDIIGIDEWRGTISNYALAKDDSGKYIYDETIAESFADVYANGSNATAASRYVVEVLKERVSGDS